MQKFIKWAIVGVAVFAIATIALVSVMWFTPTKSLAQGTCPKDDPIGIHTAEACMPWGGGSAANPLSL